MLRVVSRSSKGRRQEAEVGAGVGVVATRGTGVVGGRKQRVVRQLERREEAAVTRAWRILEERQ